MRSENPSLIERLLLKLNNQKLIELWADPDWRCLIKAVVYFLSFVLFLIALILRAMEVLIICALVWLFAMCYLFARLGNNP